MLILFIVKFLLEKNAENIPRSSYIVFVFLLLYLYLLKYSAQLWRPLLPPGR